MTLAGQATRQKKAGLADTSPKRGEEELLAWYDRHRRILPWRAAPRERPDPYRVWLSEIMLQQTTVKTVAPYFVRFVQRWPDVPELVEPTIAPPS